MTAVALSFPAGLSIFAGLGLFVLARFVWRYREYPGATFWAGVQAAAGLWATTYGLALTVFDPALQPWVIRLTWLGRAMAAPLILYFALDYTGRGHLINSTWGRAVAVAYAVAFLMYVTNHFHHLAWSGYQIEPLFGAAAPDYRIEIGTFFFTFLAYALNAVSILLLLESVLNYSELFSRQIAAITVGITLPTMANVAWLFRLGPTAHLDFTALMFLPMGLLYTYALFRWDMFELIPATTRIADNVAMDDIETAHVTISADGRIVDFNAAGADLFSIDDAALGRGIQEVLGIDIPLEAGDFSLSDVGERTGHFDVTVSPINSPDSETVGYIVSFHDITNERRRQERLSVQNRILRHNIRNGLNIVRGKAQQVHQHIESNEVEEQLSHILDQSNQLLRVSEKVREFDQVLNDDPEVFEVVELCQEIVEEMRDRYPKAQIDLKEDAEIEITARRQLFALIIREAIENGIIHNETLHPGITVGLQTQPDGEFEIIIEDDGPGIPEHEIETVQSGEEEPLSHGSGIGLWIMEWGVSVLGGSVRLGNSNTGGLVTLHFPRQ